MKIKPIIFLLFICLCICSCKSFWNIFKPETEKSKYRPTRPLAFMSSEDSMEIKTKIDNTVEKNLSEASNAINKSLVSIEKRNVAASLDEKSSKELNTALENNFYGEPKNELLKRLKNIHGKRKANDEKIFETEKSLKEILMYLSPLNMNKVKDSLMHNEWINYRDKNPNTKLTQNAQKDITKDALKQLSKIITEKSQMIMQENQTLDMLFMNENTYVFEIKELAANLSLKKFIGVINNNSYFELSSDDLSPEGKNLITRDVNIYFDSLFNCIPNLISVRDNDSIKYETTLGITIDGFADSKGFGNTPQINNELNRDLSQRRSDKIMELVLDIFNTKTKQINLKNVSFTPPTKSSVGHGEELPDPNRTYEPEGTEDMNRRIIILQCTFSIKQK